MEDLSDLTAATTADGALTEVEAIAIAESAAGLLVVTDEGAEPLQDLSLEELEAAVATLSSVEQQLTSFQDEIAGAAAGAATGAVAPPLRTLRTVILALESAIVARSEAAASDDEDADDEDADDSSDDSDGEASAEDERNSSGPGGRR